jgi:hypothetical protein
MQALKGDETMVMQWVLTPAVPAHPPVYSQSHTDTLTYRNIIHGSLASQDEIIARHESASITRASTSPVKAERLRAFPGPKPGRFTAGPGSRQVVVGAAAADRIGEVGDVVACVNAQHRHPSHLLNDLGTGR